MALTTAGSAVAGRGAGTTALLLAAALCSLSGCVANGADPIGVAALGDPVDATVAARGVDENGAAVDLQVPLPGERPIVAVAVAETTAPGEAVTTVTALVPADRSDGTISGSAAIDRMIEEAAAENGVPRELAFAVVHVESRYNPRAKGAGVYGLSQIMPSTARSLGFSGPAEALFDPATNLRYGMKYLKGAWEKGGRDVCRAAMKYKGGHRATTMTRSASAYCSNVKRQMASITGRAAPETVQIASLHEKSGVPAPTATRPIAAAMAMAPVTTLPGVSAVQAVTAGAAAPAIVAPEAAVAAPQVEALAGKTGRRASAEPVLTAAFAPGTPDASRFGD